MRAEDNVYVRRGSSQSDSDEDEDECDVSHGAENKCDEHECDVPDMLMLQDKPHLQDIIS